MTDVITLDESYSTTRLLSQKKPDILNNSEETNRNYTGGLRTKGYFKQSYDNKPLISIVTVVYNGEKYLEETIQSVINQTYDNVEYIIIDGGSTDRTLDIIRTYEDAIDYWVSEKDNGIYDAMNKGVRFSNGEYIGLLNADDRFEHYTIETIVDEIHKTKADIFYGDMILINEDQDSTFHRIASHTKLYFGMSICHPSTFISSSLYKHFNGYDLTYRMASDYDFFLKAKLNKYSFYYIPKVLSRMRDGGISANNPITHQEERAIKKKLLSYSVNMITNFALFTSKILKQIGLRK
jgi:glycosyltransferase involved in cell wall biosynthesis